MIPPIGFAGEQDQGRLTALYRQCFSEDSEAFWQWIFAHPYRMENTLVIRQGEEILSTAQMIPCTLSLGERRFPAHYIYAAATAQSARSRGLMRRILEEAAAIGRARGQQFSALITQEDSLLQYYARSGYGLFATVDEHCAEPSPLLPGERIRPITEKDFQKLEEIYRQAGKAILCIHRTEALWRQIAEQYEDGAFLLERSGAVKAYAFIDERGVMEAVGEGAQRLAARLLPAGGLWRSLPSARGKPMGCLRPLTEEAQAAGKDAVCYLNLMYN